MISRECMECEACGRCEYDALTDTVYPGDESKCLLAGVKNDGE